MTIPDHVKQPILRSFHIHTFTPGWHFDGSGPAEKDRQLLVEYGTVIEEVNLLPAAYALPAFLSMKKHLPTTPLTATNPLSSTFV